MSPRIHRPWWTLLSRSPAGPLREVLDGRDRAALESTLRRGRVAWGNSMPNNSGTARRSTREGVADSALVLPRGSCASGERAVRPSNTDGCAGLGAASRFTRVMRSRRRGRRHDRTRSQIGFAAARGGRVRGGAVDDPPFAASWRGL
jgi:hypothetical protein